MKVREVLFVKSEDEEGDAVQSLLQLLSGGNVEEYIRKIIAKCTV